MVETNDYQQMNGIQHFLFCKRQWALIMIDQYWNENSATMEGHFIHKNADDPFFEEKRGKRIFIRSVPVVSHRLKLNGVLDVLQLDADPNGAPIQKHDGLWMPYVIEYKKGKPKKDLCDIVQLVAEVMALEEMMQIEITEAALYYKAVNRRTKIKITQDLREIVYEAAQEMDEVFKKGIIPKAEISKNCKVCSLYDHCMPRVSTHKKSVVNYVKRRFTED